MRSADSTSAYKQAKADRTIDTDSSPLV